MKNQDLNKKVIVLKDRIRDSIRLKEYYERQAHALGIEVEAMSDELTAIEEELRSDVVMSPKDEPGYYAQ